MSYKIKQILDKIDDGQLFVPAFQREYVWNRKNVKEFFRSLIKRYPTGTLLTWETSNPPELKGNIKYTKERGAIKLLLDGQQRVTSLYIIMRGKYPPYYTEEEIKHDVRNLYVNLDTLELEYYKAQKMENNFLWVNLTDIFTNKIGSGDIISKISNRDFLQKIINNFQKIKNIEEILFLEQIIEIGTSLKEAINIFYMVNAMGVNLTEAELALAQISGYWPDARKIFKNKLMDLKNDGFDFKLDFIIYLLLGILYNKGDEMSKLHSSDNLESLKKVWRKLETEILDYMINILKTNYIESTKEINSVYALVPIVVYIYEKNLKLSEIEIKKMMKWFFYSQIRYRYVSQLPQKLTKDLSILKTSIENGQNPFDNLLQLIKEDRSLEISEYEFEGATINSPLFNLMKIYFKSKGALSFDGIKISELNKGKYSLEYDHIFPYSLLAKNGYKIKTPKYRLAQEITNRAIVTQKVNRTKSNKDAYSYLNEIKKNYPNALKLQLIPEDEELWKIENYEKFLAVRRKMLAKELNTFLKNFMKTDENEIKLSILDLIDSDENENLEFKSTLTWNIRANRKDNIPENSVIKTIAGFNNNEGGTLIIGVDDEHNILGLDYDYNLANLRNRDKFELHLKNILRSRLKVDNGYLAKNIKISFEEINGKDVCIVEVNSGDKPIFTTDEKFYLRDGNSTIELKPSEIVSYIKKRFN